MRVLALAALIACTPVQRRVTLGVASTALIAADWYQTRDIVARCREQNFLLGECGERISPNVYFPLALALNAAIALMLPPGWDEVWLGAVTGAQAATVWSNYAQE